MSATELDHGREGDIAAFKQVHSRVGRILAAGVDEQGLEYLLIVRSQRILVDIFRICYFERLGKIIKCHTIEIGDAWLVLESAYNDLSDASDCGSVRDGFGMMLANPIQDPSNTLTYFGVLVLRHIEDVGQSLE